MIKLADTILLTFTKLRAKKARTVVTVLLGGMLFGLLVAASLILTGAFRSLDSFRSDGLTGRYIVSVSPKIENDTAQNIIKNPALVAEAKRRYEELVDRKISEAKRLGITYTQASDTPPYMESSDGRTTMLVIRDPNGITQAVLEEYFDGQPVIDDSLLESTAKQYGALKIFYSKHYAVKIGSTLEAFDDGKEIFYDRTDEAETNTSFRKSLVDDADMTLAPEEITAPFMLPNYAGWLPDGEVLPIILPQNIVEQLTGHNTLSDMASAQEKIDQLKLIRLDAESLSFKACYRNSASNNLIQTAIRQHREMTVHEGDKDYEKPAVIYELPDPATCDDPQIVSDTRTAEEIQQDNNQREFDEIFYGVTEPISRFINFKVVGISPSQQQIASDGGARNLNDIIDSLLRTSGVGQVIPLDIYNKLPDKGEFAELFNYDPVFIFGNEDNKQRFVEFPTSKSAQLFIDEQSCTTQMDGNCLPAERLYQATFAFSNSSAIEDIQTKANQWSKYAMLLVAALAVVVMSIAIGRTIVDGRHETAVFRAVGFKRIDVAGVYILYSTILSLLVAALAVGIGLLIAHLVEVSVSKDLTARALYSFGGLDMSKKVSLVGFDWRQLGLIVAACFVTGTISTVVPLLRNIRRSPIRDMREE